MKAQAFNPYLPQGEYIPDGEPYVFGDRVYVYGSHDRFGAPMFCMNDYVCWSAPVNDLSDWRYEGVIFRKNQDPKNKLGLRLLFAPDVTRGLDGRYYLYYAFDFMGIMGVAVCDSPCGEFKFLGHVKHADGSLYGRRNGDSFPFDPGVLVDDDGHIYLYSGFYTPVPALVTGGKKLKFEGGYVMELEPDMVTIKGEEKLLFPKLPEYETSENCYFKDHEFFEASSIRKYDGKYYFVYSSRHNHELCLAVSDRPTEGFRFAGTLVSVGDLFLEEKDQPTAEPSTDSTTEQTDQSETAEPDEFHARNYLGNTHGGMLRLGDDFYIFYHRHTNRCSYARQACADKLVRDEKGNFLQAEVTSCGLNGGPLKGVGTYPARIACNLWAKHHETGRYDCKNPKKAFENHPYFTQNKKDGDERAVQYIANMRDGACAGFKYFSFEDKRTISVTVSSKGRAEGCMKVYLDEAQTMLAATIPICLDGKNDNQAKGKNNHPAGKNSNKKSEQVRVTGTFSCQTGTYPLYFCYEGQGAVDFWSFTIE